MKQVSIAISFFILFIFIFGCKSDTRQNAANTLNLSGIYRYDLNNNLIEMVLNQENDKVSGTVTYALDGKDKNLGHFEGSLNDNLLLGTFHFQSEGVMSSRQMAFEIHGDTLYEGFAPVQETDSGMVFKDPRSLTFNKSMPILLIQSE
ncbi:hypothetical protein [Robertkochia solimangrovi]|uniref:hypothetical protein n=1 Tax=Robertkochia solimangrovi TaxID=2213046 RepID=UPI00117D027D|nr:hypothetical protein [Robertkochia solimangrovi]TRZ44458.1 hypothetical protein DMZ48_08120 [Robertkochia solimangrovi]